jgi:hypothetical protein
MRYAIVRVHIRKSARSAEAGLHGTVERVSSHPVQMPDKRRC